MPLGFSFVGDGADSAVERRIGDMRWKEEGGFSSGGGGRGAFFGRACDAFTGEGGGEMKGAGGSLDVTCVRGERNGDLTGEPAGFEESRVRP